MSPKSDQKAPKPPRMSDKAEAIAARLKESLLQDKAELEVDKIFKALVKLEGSRLAPESWPASDGPRRR